MKKILLLSTLLLVIITVAYLFPFNSARKLPKQTVTDIHPTNSITPESQLKNYRNEEFGFEFDYNPNDYGELFIGIAPKRNFNETGTGEIGLDVYLFDNFSKFQWFLNNGAFSETLRYDNAANKWVIKLDSENATKEDIYCPSEVKTKSQNLPFYVIGDSRSGRANDVAYVLDKGIIVIRDSYPFEVRQNIRFDNPQRVKKVDSECVSN